MGRISIDTRQVRTLGQVLQATSQDLNRTNKRVRDRHNETQLNHQRDPNVAQIKPGVNLVDHQLTKTAREYDRLAQHATQTAKDFDNADKTGPQQRLDNRFWPRIDLPGYFPLLGTVTPLPSHPCQWPNIAPTKPRWFDWFSKGLRAGRTALNRISGGLRNFTGTVTNVGKRFINGTRGLLGKATNWASGVKDKIGDKVDGVKNKLSNGFNTIAGGLSSAFNWSKNKLTSLIKNTWNAIWDGLTTTLKTAIAGIKQLGKAARWLITTVAVVGWTVVRTRLAIWRWELEACRWLAVKLARKALRITDWAIPWIDGDFGVPEFRTPPPLGTGAVSLSPNAADYQRRARTRFVNNYFEDRLFMDDATTPVRGEGDPALNKLMESLMGNEPPTGPDLANALERMAEIRGVSEQQFKQDYEIMRQYMNSYDFSATSNVDTLVHPNHLGSPSSLRYGKVAGRYLGPVVRGEPTAIDPVFGSLLNPTGGLVGPGNFPAPNDEAIRTHGIVHDAAGHLYSRYYLGPGYDYLESTDEFQFKPSSHPLDGQIEGILFWEHELGPFVEL